MDAEKQLHVRGDVPVSPKLWLVLGVVYILLGCIQLVLAALWGHWFGMAAGLSIGKMGFSLAGLGLTGGKPPPAQGTGVHARLRAAARAAVMWGSDKVQRLFWRLRWLVYAYGGLVLLLLVVRLRSPDVPAAAFPSACAPSLWYGCARVADAVPHGGWRGAAPLRLAAPLPDVQGAVERWVREQPQAAVLRSAPGLLHARFVSLVLGFADDLYVGLRCFWVIVGSVWVRV